MTAARRRRVLTAAFLALLIQQVSSFLVTLQVVQAAGALGHRPDTAMAWLRLFAGISATVMLQDVPFTVAVLVGAAFLPGAKTTTGLTALVASIGYVGWQLLLTWILGEPGLRAVILGGADVRTNLGVVLMGVAVVIVRCFPLGGIGRGSE